MVAFSTLLSPSPSSCYNWELALPEAKADLVGSARSYSMYFSGSDTQKGACMYFSGTDTQKGACMLANYRLNPF